jgi:hypothetical protein
MKTWAKIKDWAAGVLFGEPERVVPNALGSGAAEPRPTRWGQRVPPCGPGGPNTRSMPAEGGAK